MIVKNYYEFGYDKEKIVFNIKYIFILVDCGVLMVIFRSIILFGIILEGDVRMYFCDLNMVMEGLMEFIC